MFKLILRTASLAFGIAGIINMVQGNAPGAMVYMLVALLADLQADVIQLKEDVVKLQPKKENTDATQSTQGS